MHTVTISTSSQATEILGKAAAWIRRRVESGKRVRLTLADEKRTLPQNAHLHPTIRKLARQLDRPTDDESLCKLRYLLLEQWRHETGRNPLFERSMDGLRWVNVQLGTSDLDRGDCSEFLDWLIAESVKLDA